LDVGAGSGCHSLVLQEMGKESLAIDISPWAVEVMKKRGIDAYLTKNRSEKDQKSPKAHTKTDTSSQEKLFGEIQNSFLSNLCNLW
ncbi:MAG TPA: methyltransferase domain-containing protein, partial [Candidatus Phocaeicola caecigallinarum]|nr:methyltransferase domain-containing protein [Candidatus Phocaeicola caecigallinarum]